MSRHDMAIHKNGLKYTYYKYEKNNKKYLRLILKKSKLRIKI